MNCGANVATSLQLLLASSKVAISPCETGAVLVPPVSREVDLDSTDSTLPCTFGIVAVVSGIFGRSGSYASAPFEKDSSQHLGNASIEGELDFDGLEDTEVDGEENEDAKDEISETWSRECRCGTDGVAAGFAPSIRS